MHPTIKIAFADDCKLQQMLIKMITDGNSAFELLYTCDNGIELLEKLASSSQLPQVCLIDLQMSKMGGIEATGKILKKFPDMLVFGYTSSVDESQLTRFKESGVISIFSKGNIRSALEEIRFFAQELVRPSDP